MIWLPAPDPRVGEYRVVRRFAWLPVTLVTGHRLWLERYYATEQYTRDYSELEEDRGWRIVSRTTFDTADTLRANGITPVTSADSPLPPAV